MRMEQTKVNYQFRYANELGSVIRSTFMQCPADADAISQARTIMRDSYASLEIFDGERTVYSDRA
jgi:hypothetical protein